MFRKSVKANHQPADHHLELVDLFTKFGSAYSRFVRLCIPSRPGDAVTAPRLSLLGLLMTQGEKMIMSDLADRLGVSSRTMTVLVDGLEKEGMVRRASDPKDRRATVVEITPEGTSVAKRLIGPHRANVATLFEIFDPEETATLAEMLRRMNARLTDAGIDTAGVSLTDTPV